MELPARRTKKVGRMLDQKLVEIELAFEIASAGDGKPAGTRDKKKGKARAIRREARKTCPTVADGFIDDKNITGTHSTADRSLGKPPR